MLAGIFVGGRGVRMGGVAKGLLRGPDGAPLVVRAQRILVAAGLTPVLVGTHEGYGHLAIEQLPDDPSAAGPLAGLLALLARGGGLDVLAIACDMPAFTAEAVERLRDAPAALVVAPRHVASDLGRDVWEPLFARYAGAVLPVARSFAAKGERKLQRLLDEVGATPLALAASEEAWLADWDVPGDLG